MLRLEKILVPVDLSASSMVPMQFAGALARTFDAFITLLHCGAPGDETRDRLEALGHTAFGSQPFSTIVFQGDAAQVIVDYARSAHFDLITMSTHGYGRFRRLLVGSVTTQVLDQADCPVFTGAHLEQAVAGHGIRFDTIVCAVDLGPMAGEVAKWAGDFAEAVRGRLFLLHMISQLAAAEGDYFRSDANLVPVEQASEELAALRDTLGLSAKVIVTGGGIPDAVRHQASELGADVLIAGRGTSAGRIGRLRSNAFEIIRSAPCPVITV
jgi:nucleotide-binding universal stress UspA family protein